MAKLYNLARMTTATTGTGTITLGSAVASYVTFALAGVQNGDTVTYAIVDGSNREVGRGVYTSVGTTLTRATILESTNANAAINLSGSAEVFITAAAEDITSSVQITGGSITGITDLAVADGGTGVSSLTAYAVLAGGTTSTGAVQTVSGLGTSGQVLTSNGASALPTWKSNWVQVGVYTASNSASLDVTDLSAYRAIRITMSSILPATDSVNLLLRLSSDNGANFIATSYDFSKLLVLAASTVNQATADTSFPLTGSVGNVSTDGAVGGTIIITNFNTAVYTSINSSLAVGNPSASSVFTPGGGIHRSATAMNAVRLIFSSGNITSGNIIVEGLV